MSSTAETLETPLGVIDSLQHGFDLINRRPWLLIIPLLVDLLLWRGPRLSIAPLFARGVDLFTSQPEVATSLTPDMQTLLETFRRLGDSYNLLALLAGSITGLPSLLARVDVTTGLAPVSPAVTLHDFRQVLLYIVLLIPAGLLIGSVWLAFLARATAPEASERQPAWRHAGWIWFNTGLYLLLLAGAALIMGVLFALFSSILILLLGPSSQYALLVLSFWFTIWIGIGLSFVISAIALDGVNVARAVWRSINVVGRNLSSTIGLLLLILLLSEGFTRIWLLIGGSTLGLSIGILGHAYIGVALTAATLLFYRARYEHWQRLRQNVAEARRKQADTRL